ncbi:MULTISPECIES: rod shape-determining protein MreD [unclassified Iodidimonas]|jgi:rod shape-determining protein MreD|uniref:rod shape-determining protein MreD n=1 Tax=unclassified Iodidimonas TaxID=2626145 RepID=UPI002482DB08|nr:MULTISPECIES: rod shape-determining protein MreD [unclassified Iodidimonas]
MSERTGGFGLALLRSFGPAVIAAVLIIIMHLPYGDASGGVPLPHMALIVVYYWSIHRPDLLPIGLVAAIGFFLDMLSGGPPGLNMLVLMIAQIVLSNQQALFVRQSFAVGWLGFVPVMFLAMLLSWIIASLYYGVNLSAMPVIAQGLVTLAAYPLFGWIFGWFDKMIKADF